MTKSEELVLRKTIRGLRKRHMGWRYANACVAMQFDWIRFHRLNLVSPERAQYFLAYVTREWLMIGELTFAEELSQFIDLRLFPIGEAAQEISFLLTLPKIPGLIRRLICQVRSRLELRNLDDYKSEYVDKVCLLAEFVANYDDGEWEASKFYSALKEFRSFHHQVNYYYFDVVREYRPLFRYEDMKPLYLYFKSWFKDHDNPYGEFMKTLNKMMREERKALRSAK